MTELNDLNKDELLRLIQDAIRDIISHGALWFRAAEEELGMDEAIDLDNAAWADNFPRQSGRLCRGLGWEEKAGIPSFFLNLSKDKLLALWTDLGSNWLTNDGVWFRTVEEKHGMAVAKKLNDEAWKRFAIIEARRIMSRLSIEENGGIDALEQALKFRLYAGINQQQILHLPGNKLVFRMSDCRVQSARKRENLPEYPCKSAGMVEFTNFAGAVDSRIETRCLACPPEPHPGEYWCAWEFELRE